MPELNLVVVKMELILKKMPSDLIVQVITKNVELLLMDVALMVLLPNGTKLVKIVQNMDVKLLDLVVVLMKLLQKLMLPVKIVPKTLLNVKEKLMVAVLMA